MKKIVLTLSLFLCLILFAGCDGVNEHISTSTSGSVWTVPPANPDRQPVETTTYGSGTKPVTSESDETLPLPSTSDPILSADTTSAPVTTTRPVPVTTPSPEPLPEPSDEDFVKILDYIPDAIIDLRYATENNFTGMQIYAFEDAWLRYGTVKKLAEAADELREQGYRLKIWDAFRPPAAQWKLWEICPDPTYVSNPNKGYSSHSRGNTVDITLCYADGSELLMPTGFDDFTPAADRDYSDVSDEAAGNALLLEKVMSDFGFKPYSGEWWHFSDRTVYEVEEEFLSGEI